MKLLYLSCHSILEYDEVKLFTDMGIDVFSHGSYSNPRSPGDEKRPPIEGKYDDHMVQLAMRYGKTNLHPEMIAPFDAIMVMHLPEYVLGNWGNMKHKHVIWRSIGQSTVDVENQLAVPRNQGMKIVRYSPMERTIQGYIGEDAMIRFYKDPDDFGGWTGTDKKVITIGQSMKKRDKYCNFTTFYAATQGFKRKLFGPDNDGTGALHGGVLSYTNLKRELRTSRVYFYTGTHPASYTLNFLEAWMTGIPVVAIGPKLGNPQWLNQHTYEIPMLIKNGVNGFWSDDIGKLREYIQRLMDDDDLAATIGAAGRKAAIEHFGMTSITSHWGEFFNTL